MKNQKKNLNDEGIVFMILWRGDYKEEMLHNGEIRFTYYLESDIKEIIETEDDYDILKIEC